MSTNNPALRFSFTRTVCRYLPPIVSQRVRAMLYPLHAGIKDDFAHTAFGQTGSPMRVRTSEYHQYCFAMHGYFDWRNIAIAAALLREGDTVIEIGANIGTETLGFSDIVGARGTVAAFEPLPSNREVLEQTAAGAHHANIRVFPLALSDEKATLKFSVPPKHQTGLGFLVHGVGVGDEAVSVECRTLDSMAEELGDATGLYIDVEGEEVRVLRGAREYIRAWKPFIVIEAIAGHLERSGFSLQDLYDELRAPGYEVYEITRLGVTKLDALRFHCEGNWLCLPTGEEDKAQRVGKAVFAAGTRPCIKGINPISK